MADVVARLGETLQRLDGMGTADHRAAIARELDDLSVAIQTVAPVLPGATK